MRTCFIRAQLPIDVLVESSSSEAQGNRTDGKNSSTAQFLLVIPSVEQPAFVLRDFTLTLIGNQVNNPIVVQSPIRMVDIGGNFGYCFNPSDVAIPATAIVEAAGAGSIVAVTNSGTQTWASGFPFVSGWQPSAYVRLVNINPESTSLFSGKETLIFPLKIDAVDRGLATNLTDASGGFAAFYSVSNAQVGGVLCDSNRVRYLTTSSVFFTSGAGSPEGVLTAPVGSLYTRTNGGAGTTLYVKETGSGNTGWIAK
jgi:hypothetical protein